MKNYREEVALYWHFPFCRNFCYYCHFFKLPYDRDLVTGYLNLFQKELLLYPADDYYVKTIYFGGGSPSLLTADQIIVLKNSLANSGVADQIEEWTIECNAQDINEEKLEAFIKAGINRISLGVQSFLDDDLKILARSGTGDEILKKIELIRSAGFSNLSLDLLLGFRKQNFKSIEQNLQAIAQVKPEHVSVYLFSRKNDSHLAEKEQFIIEGYHYYRLQLKQLGYHHYEVSNYAFPGYECRHNLFYWRNKPYIGTGAGASGYLKGIDYKNYKNFRIYRSAVEKGKLPRASKSKLNDLSRELICRMRLLEGIELEKLLPLKNEIEKLIQADFLIREVDRIKINPEKILLLNEILKDLVCFKEN